MINKINRTVLLNLLIKHETLTINELAKLEVMGVKPDAAQLSFLLKELNDSGHLVNLKGTDPLTYSITRKGIEEGVRLNKIS